MPANTGVPTSRRLISAAPRAITSGTNPRMNANDVIITARNRVRAPSTAASRMPSPASRRSFGELHDQDAVLRRQRNQHHQPDLRIEIQRQARRPA